MLLFLVAYLGGVLTIVSPCILPVLPFVFARLDRSFLRNGLPMLAGMALAFASIASLAAVAGGWAVETNRYGRLMALVLLAGFGFMLLLPATTERLMRPFVNLGSRLSRVADAYGGTGGSVLLGVATGLLWAPCAGPVLGLILTGAALQGANIGTALLLLAYAMGAATSLALALLVGGHVLSAMKRSLGASEWVRRGLGAVVLTAVVAIAMGLDTGVLRRLSLSGTVAVEERLISALGIDAAATLGDGPAMMQASPTMMAGGSAMTAAGSAMSTTREASPEDLPVEGSIPPLSGAVEWLNSQPLTADDLKGKVVLIDFWTYSCINCLRAIPYVQAWAQKYKDQGLVVIGVHTPEFAFEKDLGNVRKAASDLKISYPIAIDNDYAIWRAFKNRYWPAHYFVDAEGRVRHHKFGEGGYGESERVIQELLTEAGSKEVASGIVSVKAAGAQASSDATAVLSPETYIGYERAQSFVSPGGAVRDKVHNYADGSPRLNEWGLDGMWTVGREHAVLNGREGSIVYRFHARDLHLVLGPAANGKPIRFKVTVDGQAPGADHGVDVDAAGMGVVDGQRLYQLVRQKDPSRDRTFEIRFFDEGVEAYAFTFG